MKTRIIIVSLIAFIFGGLSALTMFPASWPSWVATLSKGEPAQKALIGGPFTLIDHTRHDCTG